MQQCHKSENHEPTLYCPHCSYNLTGLPEDRCPECGNVFDLEELKIQARNRVDAIGTSYFSPLTSHLEPRPSQSP